MDFRLQIKLVDDKVGYDTIEVVVEMGANQPTNPFESTSPAALSPAL